MAKKRHAATGLIILALATFGTTLLFMMWMNAFSVKLVVPTSTGVENPFSSSGKDQNFQQWTSVKPGVEFRDIPQEKDGKSFVFHLVRLDPTQVSFSIAHQSEGKSLRSWLGDSEGIVINAGFFKQANEPVGLLYIDGQRIDEHRIRPEGTGIVEVIGKQVNIYPLTPEMSTQPLKVNYALQSFPLLIVDGQVNELTASSDIDRRTAVAKGKDQKIYLITVDEPVLSLSEFAQELMKTDVGFENVLNLDGGSSTGIIAKYGDFYRLIDTQTFVPTIIQVK